MSLKDLQRKFSMAQLALLSHVAMCKNNDFEKEREKEKKEEGNKGPGKKSYINKDNSEAYMLIASGILG